MKLLKNNIFTDNNADANGFIHLVNYQAYSRIINKLHELPNWTPLKEKAPNYPWKYGDNDYYRSYVEVYIEKNQKL